MPVTIQDIAQKLGISVSTVSKALNDYDDVSEATRKRVQKIAHELGYYPSSTAQSLRRRQTNKIGLVVNYPIAAIGEYLSQLIIGAAIAAEPVGYHVILYTTFADQNERITRICRAREVDGLLLLWNSSMAESIELMQNEKMPFVVVARRMTDFDVPYVVADNLGGAKDLTRHLIALGHRRIAFTSLPEVKETNLDRLQGYRQALEEAGIAYDENLVVPVTMEAENRYAMINFLLDLPKPPTAIFAFHDYVAIEALRAVADRGLRVPEDIAIAGFDGMNFTLTTSPPLTTVVQPVQEMGKRAVELLVECRSNEIKTPTQVILPVELAIRQSTIGARSWKERA